MNYFGNANALKLIITGHIAEHKGQKDAILAVKELIMKGKKVELLIVGSSVSWYREELERIVLDENLGAYVKFFEFKDNPYPVVKQADIVLVCSRSEALGRDGEEVPQQQLTRFALGGDGNDGRKPIGVGGGKGDGEVGTQRDAGRYDAVWIDVISSAHGSQHGRRLLRVEDFVGKSLLRSSVLRDDRHHRG